MGSIFPQDVVSHVHVVQLGHVVVVVADDALERVHAGFLRGHAAAHVLDDGVRSGNLDIFFSAAGGAGGAHVLVGIAAGSNDRRIAATARQLEGEAAGGGDTGNFAFVVQCRTVNGAGGRKQGSPHGCELELRLDAEIGRTLA